MKHTNNIIISEGYRPLLHRIIAAILYTVMFFCLFYFFSKFRFTTNTDALKENLNFLELAIFSFIGSLSFSGFKNVVFDLGKNKYKEEYCIGPIKVGKWKNLPEIDYVSVFKQPLEEGKYIYETNLWYQKNKHFNIYSNVNLEPVFEMGKSVSKILKVDLLDATIPNDYKWVDLNDFLKE